MTVVCWWNRARHSHRQKLQWDDIPYRDANPVYCAVENGRLDWFTVPTDPFDKALDIEIALERLGRARYSQTDLAEIIGVHPASIRPMLIRKVLPQPRYREDVEGERDHGVWLPSQVAEIIMARTR